MPILLSNEKWVQEVKTIVLRLMHDEQVEVREKAGQVMSGLLHSSFLKETEELIKLFTKLSQTKVSKGENNVAFRKRHTGVLGLCAFLAAHPYEVPDFIPAIFENLVSNINDNAAIMVKYFMLIIFKIQFNWFLV